MPQGKSAPEKGGVIIANVGYPAYVHFMWKEISSAPFERDVRLAFIDEDGVHALAFACRRIPGGWINTKTAQEVNVHPSHWSDWRPAQFSSL